MDYDVQAQHALFRQLMGAQAFDGLPLPLQRLHIQQGSRTYLGEVEVVRGPGVISRLCAWVTRLPAAGSGPITVEIVSDGNSERWIRNFAGHSMASKLWNGAGVLCERLGLVTFGFNLENRADDIVWTVCRVRVLGVLPLPTLWFLQVRAREWAEGDRYHFDVRAVLPLAGQLVHYRGWLGVP